MSTQSAIPQIGMLATVRNRRGLITSVEVSNSLKGDKVVKTLLHQGKSKKTALKKARFMGLEAN
jgi:hypothetical protein